MEQSNIVMNVKIKQRARLPPGLINNEIIESIVLGKSASVMKDVAGESMHIHEVLSSPPITTLAGLKGRGE